ncbi:hypothetical protein KKA39_03140 [Patescibacteria group bacterium]|nr:hypothetical protein [Patescibacteria group bacterium]MBU1728270.1 hypothetical protein [Patescibacteria group bacterium]
MNPIQKNLTEIFELDKLLPEEREEFIIRVGSVIYQNVLMRALETMSDKDQNGFERILDNNGSPQEIFGFLKEKVKDFEKIITEEAEKFKNKTENIMGQIGN